MLISGVHFDFFLPKRKPNYMLGDYKKVYCQSQLRSGEIAKKKEEKNNKKPEMLGTPPLLGHLSVYTRILFKHYNFTTLFYIKYRLLSTVKLAYLRTVYS